MKKTIWVMLCIFILGIGGFFGYQYLTSKTVEVEKTELYQLIYISGEDIIEKDLSTELYEKLSTKKYIPESLLTELGFLYSEDKEENRLSIVSYDTLMRYDLTTGILSYDGELKESSQIPLQVDGQWLIAEEDFGTGANLGWYVNDQRKILMALNNKSDYFKATVMENTDLHKERDLVDSKVRAKIDVNNDLFVGQSIDGLTEVVTGQLLHGYVLDSALAEPVGYKTILEPKVFFQYSETPINMTWEAVYSKNPNVANIPAMEGLNVISPTWMSLADSEGNINKKLISNTYTQWAHDRGYEIWPLISNDFKPERTSDFLKSTKARETFIDELLTIALENRFDGINIDFENVFLEDKDRLSQFVAELAQTLRLHNITVSMDVTTIGGSDNWSRCYDRLVLGQHVDYLVIMAYDQYWAASPVSGPVAAYSWVNDKMNEIIGIVPAHKVVLGMPTYMRLWREVPSTEKANTMKAKSETLSMNRLMRLMEENDFNFIWDEGGQHYYIGYIKDNVLIKIWVEDGRSIRAKTAYARENKLAGVATWRRGFETQDIWGIIEEELNK